MSSPLRVLLDTNVVLDVLLARQPRVNEAAGLWAAADDGRLTGYLPASALTDIYYVANRISGPSRAREAVRLCLTAFEFCPTDRAVLQSAFHRNGPDFEDDVQIASAESARLDAIVTRDGNGFKGSVIPIWSPTQCLQKL
ncbi:MAG: PIN domain-containing protein [Candidatus Eremiobacteraeota bacterium]|nr:PIN domain-containing protein [Candidatus Eremiobacteraeota bacterium]MCW5870197.1 PIN domain-containing protein [Candidatus Eremiobacteraeota bacterium]